MPHDEAPVPLDGSYVGFSFWPIRSCAGSGSSARVELISWSATILLNQAILNLIVELFKHCTPPARPSRVLSVLLSLLLLQLRGRVLCEPAERLQGIDGSTQSRGAGEPELVLMPFASPPGIRSA